MNPVKVSTNIERENVVSGSLIFLKNVAKIESPKGIDESWNKNIVQTETNSSNFFNFVKLLFAFGWPQMFLKIFVEIITEIGMEVYFVFFFFSNIILIL